jgi:hypothetical protein
VAIAHRATSSLYQGTASSTTHAVPYPASLVAGDVIFLVLGTGVADNPANTPAGWNLAVSANPTSVSRNLAVFWKAATGSETGSETVTIPSAAVGQGAMVAYSGVDTTTPIDVTPVYDEGLATSSHAAPSTTPSTADTYVAYIFLNGGAGDTWTTNPAGTTERFEATATISSRSVLFVDKPGPASGVASGTGTAIASGSGNALRMTLAIRAAVSPGYDETMRPTALSGLTNLTGAYTDIDQDPDSTITDPGLLGPDPSAQSGLLHGPIWPNARAGATGQTAFAWTGSANATDQSDTSFATEPSANTTKGDYFEFLDADFSGVPDGAAITSIQYQIKHRAGTTGRASLFCQMGTANGTLVGSETTVATSLATTAGGITHNVNATGTLPTVAQIKGSSFGVRLRMVRSNTTTYELYYLRILITYSMPAQTTNTQADVGLDDPVGTLSTGTATGEITGRIRKRGSGSNPQGAIELSNAARTWTQSVIANTTITESDADGQLVSGTFDQSIITDKTDVVARFVGTGAAGGLAELVAVEWNAQTEAAALQPINLVGAVGIRGEG